MSAAAKSRRGRWCIVVAIVVLIGAIGGAMWWEHGQTNAAVMAQRQAMKRASQGRLRIKAFVQAAHDGNVAKLAEMLKSDPDLATTLDSQGATPLHTAAWENQSAAAALLLDHGADIEFKDRRYHETPLNWAVIAGKVDVAKLLLQRGAKPNPDMLDEAERGARGEMLHYAGTPREQYPKLVTLLVKAGAKPPVSALYMSRLRDPKLPLKTIALPIRGIWPPDRLKLMKQDGNLLASMLNVGSTAQRTADGLTLYDAHDYAGVMTPDAYTTPMAIEVIAMTDGTDLRVYFGLTELIFNWQYRLTQLRTIDPVTGESITVDDQGKIPPKQFVKVKWIFTRQLMEVLVDGQVRFKRNGDYTRLHGRIGVGPADRSTVTVKSITVSPMAD